MSLCAFTSIHCIDKENGGLLACGALEFFFIAGGAMAWGL
jgi:hypothetical protein